MTATTSTTSEKPRVAADARDVCRFLSEYSGWILGSGASCIRLEKNVRRIAHAYGKKAEITITPHHVHISIVAPDNDEAASAIASSVPGPVSFNIITELSRLSWEIADTGLTLDAARRRLADITGNDKQNKWLVLALVAVANASFCRLFGGDITAMAIVCIATFAGYYIKQCLLGAGVDLRVTVIVCAFVSSVLGATDYLFALGSTPAITIGTSILYLVPGIPYLNSFSDMLYRYYICSFSRLMDALVLTACLSAGLCAGMMLMNVGMF